MKKYYAYVAKDMVGYFENEAAKHGVNIINRELINDSELYYYVVEANDFFFYIFDSRNKHLL